MPKERITHFAEVVSLVQFELAKKHERNRPDVYASANIWANNGLPGANDVSIEPFISGIRSYYNNLKQDVALSIKQQVANKQVPVDVSTINIEIRDTVTATERENTVINQANTDKTRLCLTSDSKAYKRSKVWKYIIAIGEASWLVAPMLYISDYLITAIVTSCLLAFTQTLLVEKCTQYIKEVPSPKRKKRLTRIAVASIVGLGLVIGGLRYASIPDEIRSHLNLLVVNPGTFAFLNSLLLTAVALLVIVNYPTRAEIKAFQAVDRFNRIIADATKRRNAACEVKHELEGRRRDILLNANECAHAEQKLCEKIDHYFLEAAAWFVSENCAKSPGRPFPPAFENAIAPLEPTSTFDNTVEYLTN